MSATQKRWQCKVLLMQLLYHFPIKFLNDALPQETLPNLKCSRCQLEPRCRSIFCLSRIQDDGEKKNASNKWLSEELESSSYEETTDYLSEVLQARAEEIVREYSLSKSRNQSRREVPTDSTQPSTVEDDSTDSLEEILDKLGGTKGQCSLPISSSRPLRGTMYFSAIRRGAQPI